MKCTNLDIAKPLKLVGGKWKIAIIYVLSKGPVRFGEIKRLLTPITQQMLTKQLREHSTMGAKKKHQFVKNRGLIFINE